MNTQRESIKIVKNLIPKPIRAYVKHRLLYINERELWTRSHSKLMIIGCGRSGTTYISRYLDALGINIPHEKLGKQGIVAWWLSSDQKRASMGPTFFELRGFNFPVVHQVREPLAAISSLQTMNSQSVSFAAKEIPIDLMNDSSTKIAMKYWYYWNLLSEEKAHMTYRVENVDNEIHKLLDIGRFDVAHVELPNISKETNSRKHSKKHVLLDWELLEKTDKELTGHIKDLAVKYGYDVR